ncbi:MAG: methyltransferase domain-containing protein [Thermoanaerobaculia bacterium]|nr:methyltransferase domain-containing protein [Thermoanaerobaculia bacterium]
MLAATRSPDEVRALIASVPRWYHRIELSPGLVTPGINDSPRVLQELALPADLKGARALDLGTRDGYFAFELERRGADVLAIDYCAADETGFGVASAILGSRVFFRQANIYELRARDLGTFDVVLFLGLIYHLPDPMRAIRIVRGLSRRWMWLESHLGLTGPETIDGTPMMVFYPRATLGGDPTNYWGPNRACLRAMLEENEFRVAAESEIGNRGFFRCETVEDERLGKLGRLAYGGDDPRSPGNASPASRP